MKLYKWSPYARFKIAKHGVRMWTNSEGGETGSIENPWDFGRARNEWKQDLVLMVVFIFQPELPRVLSNIG